MQKIDEMQGSSRGNFLEIGIQRMVKTPMTPPFRTPGVETPAPARGRSEQLRKNSHTRLRTIRTPIESLLWFGMRERTQ
jgi:hypothetical protein